MKVFVFSDTHWALGRVHRDVMKELDHEVRYTDWDGYSTTEFIENYAWCDKCITNLVAYKTLKPYLPILDLKKCIFVSHGYPEHEHAEYDSNLTYGMTCEALRELFPSTITPFLMPNGVDPDAFNYCPRDGSLKTLGWCGAPHVPSKQVDWAYAISNETNIPLKLATHLSYDELRAWYNTIDVLLITAVPEASKESGPLPAFEAIVSGVPVIGTPVGNFRHIPGPKIVSIDEAVYLLNYYKTHPDELVHIANEQYTYVMKYLTYKVLAPKWQHALEFS